MVPTELPRSVQNLCELAPFRIWRGFLSEQQWMPGDIVGVKSGGPPMTVARIEAGRVFCEWFDAKNPMRADFAAVVLERRLSYADGMKEAVDSMKRNLRDTRRV
jgi:uncharacterized protein YodC (DUF2158 family)